LLLSRENARPGLASDECITAIASALSLYGLTTSVSVVSLRPLAGLNE